MSPEAASIRARDLAAQWFLDSGIQEASGGVARYYRTDWGRNYRISTEITGYAASAFVWLYRTTGNPRLLEAGLRAGRFLVERAWDASSGLFPFEYATDGLSVEPLAYFFDNGIVVRGLLALHRAAGHLEFLNTAKYCAARMAEDFRAAEGFHAVLRLPEKEAVSADGAWSRSPGCYHLKAALAWRELAEAGDPACAALFERALAYALATHRDFLPEHNEPAVMDRLHAYCYFLEGLLACADRAECRRALGEGIQKARLLLEAIAPEFERGDVRAQLLRVRVFADALGVARLDDGEAEREAARILEFQALEPDPRKQGGFWFGRRKGQWLPFINPYTTAFAIQALDLWRDHRRGKFLPVWQDLI